MGEFDSFAGTCKRQDVLANHIPPPHDRETDRTRATGARQAVTNEVPDSASVVPRAAATTSPILRAVPEGASFLWR